MWPDFASELSEATGIPSQLRADGALMIAHDRDAAEALERAIVFRAELGLEVKRLLASEARELEPALAPTVRLAASLPTEQSVDPRWLSQALADAARSAGAILLEEMGVSSLLRAGDRVGGVRLTDGSSVTASRVVVAAGAWSGTLGEVPVRPVKGQIVRLRDPGGAGLLSRVLRFEGGYLVPRGDGRYTLGATVEEQGFATSLTANAAYQLLRDASRVLPAVLELELEEITYGFRPGTPDNVPVIGNDSLKGLLWATGHYRNGILLTPVTAQLVLAALDGSPHPDDALLAPANSADRD
jgi:glycine oxidase